MLTFFSLYWLVSVLIAFAIRLGDDVLARMLFSFPIIIAAPIGLPFYLYDYIRTHSGRPPAARPTSWQ